MPLKLSKRSKFVLAALSAAAVCVVYDASQLRSAGLEDVTLDFDLGAGADANNPGRRLGGAGGDDAHAFTAHVGGRATNPSKLFGARASSLACEVHSRGSRLGTFTLLGRDAAKAHAPSQQPPLEEDYGFLAPSAARRPVAATARFHDANFEALRAFLAPQDAAAAKAAEPTLRCHVAAQLSFLGATFYTHREERAVAPEGGWQAALSHALGGGCAAAARNGKEKTGEALKKHGPVGKAIGWLARKAGLDADCRMGEGAVDFAFQPAEGGTLLPKDGVLSRVSVRAPHTTYTAAVEGQGEWRAELKPCYLGVHRAGAAPAGQPCDFSLKKQPTPARDAAAKAKKAADAGARALGAAGDDVCLSVPADGAKAVPEPFDPAERGGASTVASMAATITRSSARPNFMTGLFGDRKDVKGIVTKLKRVFGGAEATFGYNATLVLDGVVDEPALNFNTQLVTGGKDGTPNAAAGFPEGSFAFRAGSTSYARTLFAVSEVVKADKITHPAGGFPDVPGAPKSAKQGPIPKIAFGFTETIGLSRMMADAISVARWFMPAWLESMVAMEMGIDVVDLLYAIDLEKLENGLRYSDLDVSFALDSREVPVATSRRLAESGSTMCANDADYRPDAMSADGRTKCSDMSGWMLSDGLKKAAWSDVNCDNLQTATYQYDEKGVTKTEKVTNFMAWTGTQCCGGPTKTRCFRAPPPLLAYLECKSHRGGDCSKWMVFEPGTGKMPMYWKHTTSASAPPSEEWELFPTLTGLAPAPHTECVAASCDTVRMSGAGTATANGEYTRITQAAAEAIGLKFDWYLSGDADTGSEERFIMAFEKKPAADLDGSSYTGPTTTTSTVSGVHNFISLRLTNHTSNTFFDSETDTSTAKRKGSSLNIRRSTGVDSQYGVWLDTSDPDSIKVTLNLKDKGADKMHAVFTLDKKNTKVSLKGTHSAAKTPFEFRGSLNMDNKEVACALDNDGASVYDLTAKLTLPEEMGADPITLAVKGGLAKGAPMSADLSINIADPPTVALEVQMSEGAPGAWKTTHRVGSEAKPLSLQVLGMDQMLKGVTTVKIEGALGKAQDWLAGSVALDTSSFAKGSLGPAPIMTTNCKWGAVSYAENFAFKVDLINTKKPGITTRGTVGKTRTALTSDFLLDFDKQTVVAKCTYTAVVMDLMGALVTGDGTAVTDPTIKVTVKGEANANLLSSIFTDVELAPSATPMSTSFYLFNKGPKSASFGEGIAVKWADTTPYAWDFSKFDADDGSPATGGKLKYVYDDKVVMDMHGQFDGSKEGVTLNDLAANQVSASAYGKMNGDTVTYKFLGYQQPKETYPTNKGFQFEETKNGNPQSAVGASYQAKQAAMNLLLGGDNVFDLVAQMQQYEKGSKLQVQGRGYNGFVGALTGPVGAAREQLELVGKLYTNVDANSDIAKDAMLIDTVGAMLTCKLDYAPKLLVGAELLGRDSARVQLALQGESKCDITAKIIKSAQTGCGTDGNASGCSVLTARGTYLTEPLLASLVLEGASGELDSAERKPFSATAQLMWDGEQRLGFAGTADAIANAAGVEKTKRTGGEASFDLRTQNHELSVPAIKGYRKCDRVYAIAFTEETTVKAATNMRSADSRRWMAAADSKGLAADVVDATGGHFEMAAQWDEGKQSATWLMEDEFISDDGPQYGGKTLMPTPAPATAEPTKECSAGSFFLLPTATKPAQCGCAAGQEQYAEGRSCTCKPGYEGVRCTIPICPVDADGKMCGGPEKGLCNEATRVFVDGKSTGVCQCGDKWYGKDCSMSRPSCPTGANEKECSGNGKCVMADGNPKCVCRVTNGQLPTSSNCGVLPKCDQSANGKTCGGNGVCKAKIEGFSTGECDCVGDFTGNTCEENEELCPKDDDGKECSGNGKCDGRLGCQCDKTRAGHRWTGYNEKGVLNCSEEPTCIKDANDRPCSGHGECQKDTLTCKCNLGFRGSAACAVTPATSAPTPAPVVPVDKKCPMYGGAPCNKVGTCNKVDGTCTCPPGTTGAACETFRRCPTDGNLLECSGRGYCDRSTYQCTCNDGYSGAACQKAPTTCPTGSGGAECSGRVGYSCFKGWCWCPAGYGGKACETKRTCPKNEEGKECGGQGTCDATTARCTCNTGYSGAACSDIVGCPRATEIKIGETKIGTGIWQRSRNADATQCGRGGDKACNTQTNKCDCDRSPDSRGFEGEACELRKASCPTDTDGRECGGLAKGVCVLGFCKCRFGQTGAACDTDPKPTPCPTNNIANTFGFGKECSGAGSCVYKTIVRDTFNRTAAGGAGAYSYKKIGTCSCESNRFGWSCGGAYQTCPANANGECSGNGKCNKFSGACTCHDGYEGADCAETVAVTCPKFEGVACGGNGKCKAGACLCKAGFIGAACGMKLLRCPVAKRFVNGVLTDVECGGNGLCERDINAGTAKCRCVAGYGGDDCNERKTCPACQNQGVCNPFTGKCLCRYGYSGNDCATTCPVDDYDVVCSGRGLCAGGKCKCVGGFIGEKCEANPCPRDASGLVCGIPANQPSVCRVSPITGHSSCACPTGKFGRACQYNRDNLEALFESEEWTSLREFVTNQLYAMTEQREERVSCKDPAKPFFCPKTAAVTEDMQGTCQATRKDCGSKDKKKACKADVTKRWCGISCIDKKLRCPLSRACKPNQVRCADGSCAGLASRCKDASSLCENANEVPCGDGVTCAASERACRAAVQLNGCPVGQYACPANPRECRVNKKDCRCSKEGDKFCGWKRNDKGRLLRVEETNSEGALVSAKVPVCKPACAGGANPLAVEPLPSQLDMLPKEEASVDVEAVGADDTSAKVGAIKIAAGAVESAGNSKPVTFAVAPVALQDAVHGALSSVVAMSAAISLTPDRVVEIDPDVGIQIDLCVADDEAQADAANCATLLERLRPYSSQDVTNADDLAEVVGGCTKGDACGCSCRFTTPHLTSFVVADGTSLKETPYQKLGEISNEQIDAGLAGGEAPPAPVAPTPAPAPGGGGGGGLLVPVVAACAAVALLAAGIVIKKKRGSGPLPQHSVMEEAHPQVEMGDIYKVRTPSERISSMDATSPDERDSAFNKL